MLILKESVPVMLVTGKLCSKQGHVALPCNRCDRASGAGVVVVAVLVALVQLVPLVFFRDGCSCGGGGRRWLVVAGAVWLWLVLGWLLAVVGGGLWRFVVVVAGGCWWLMVVGGGWWWWVVGGGWWWWVVVGGGGWCVVVVVVKLSLNMHMQMIITQYDGDEGDDSHGDAATETVTTTGAQG